MKKNQKNSTGIMLVAVQTEKNQKQKRKKREDKFSLKDCLKRK